MSIIYKYELPPSGAGITLKKGSQFLSVQEQSGLVQMWFLIDQNEPENETRNFCAFATGERIPFGVRKYLGTFQMRSGLVFHAFEIL